MNALIIFAASYLYLIIGLIFIVFFFLLPERKRKGFIILTLFTVVICVIGDKILGMIFNNPRPFVVEKVTPLVAHATDNGFPSGHTLISTALAAIVFVYNRKLAYGLGLLAIIVGLARVVAKVHHLVDIAGSIVLAVFAVYLAVLLIKKFFPKVMI